MSAMIRLKDGSEVPKEVFNITLNALIKITESDNDPLYELMKKCQDPLYQFEPNLGIDSKKLLKDLSLIDADEKVTDVVKKIVFNAIEGNDRYSIHLVSPLKI